MLEISLQNVNASFGRLNGNDDSPYVLGFKDPESGIFLTVPIEPDKCREFLQAALDSMGGVVPVRKPKLIVPGSKVRH